MLPSDPRSALPRRCGARLTIAILSERNCSPSTVTYRVMKESSITNTSGTFRRRSAPSNSERRVLVATRSMQNADTQAFERMPQVTASPPPAYAENSPATFHDPPSVPRGASSAIAPAKGRTAALRTISRPSGSRAVTVRAARSAASNAASRGLSGAVSTMPTISTIVPMILARASSACTGEMM